MPTISTTLGGFTPLFDCVIAEVGTIGGIVFGRVWRYCQGDRSVCQASLSTIAAEVGLSRRTVIRHLAALCDAGYLQDLTPDLRNKPHTYANTGKVRLQAELRGVTESHSGSEWSDTESLRGVTQSHCGSDRKSLEETIEETSKETRTQESGANAPPAGAGTRDIPITFPEWQEQIRESQNRAATLRFMFETLYPGCDPPSYGYIGKVARQVGGAGRLADLMWQHSTRPPTGDVLAYILACKDGWKGRRNGQPQEPAREVEQATGFYSYEESWGKPSPGGSDAPGMGDALRGDAGATTENAMSQLQGNRLVRQERSVDADTGPPG